MRFSFFVSAILFSNSYQIGYTKPFLEADEFFTYELLKIAEKKGVHPSFMHMKDVSFHSSKFAFSYA